jgi:hypothetical protein
LTQKAKKRPGLARGEFDREETPDRAGDVAKRR